MADRIRLADVEEVSQTPYLSNMVRTAALAVLCRELRAAREALIQADEWLAAASWRTDATAEAIARLDAAVDFGEEDQ